MEEAVIRQVLAGLNCEKIHPRAGKWIVASCPFSPVSHPKKRDSKPSFAVGINPLGSSGWTCYTCHKSGWIGHLVSLLERSLGVLYSEELHILAKSDDTPNLEQLQEKLQSLTYRGNKTTATSVAPPKKIDKLEPIDESTLKRYSHLSLEAILYLQSEKRQMTLESIIRWEFGWDADGFRIVIPIRDHDRKLVGLSRRHIGEGTPKYLHSKGFKRDLVLYGEHLIDPLVKRAYVVEGFFDTVWMDQCGFPNVLAIMGSYPSAQQSRFLKSHFDEVVVIGDGDTAGVDMARRVEEVLVPDVKVIPRYCPEGRDPNDMSRDEICRMVENEPECFVDAATEAD